MHLLDDIIIPYIKSHEGYSATAYVDDYSGTPDVIEYSIGYGHQIQPNETLLRYANLTAQDAENLLISDLNNRYAPQVLTFVKKYFPSATPQQFTALTHLTYAAGGAWMNKKLGTAIKEGAGPDVIIPLWKDTGIRVKKNGVFTILPQLQNLRTWEISLFFGEPAAITASETNAGSAPGTGKNSGNRIIITIAILTGIGVITGILISILTPKK